MLLLASAFFSYKATRKTAHDFVRFLIPAQNPNVPAVRQNEIFFDFFLHIMKIYNTNLFYTRYGGISPANI